MDNYCAPQWVDFSSSPQVPCDDYFEKFHDIYESNICTDITKNNIKIKKKISEIIGTPKKSMQLQVEDSIQSTPNLNEDYKTEIDNLKSTPIKVICPIKHSSGKYEVLKEVTYDNVLLEAIQNFQIGANLHKVTKELDLSSKENIFKKPMPVRIKTSKPVRIYDMDKSNISISRDEETKNKSSNVNMIKRNKDSSVKITENVTKISQNVDSTKCDKKNSTVKSDHFKVKVDNKNIKSKSSIAKQQTSVMQETESTKRNTGSRFVTIRKQKDKEELKCKATEKDCSKSIQLQHSSISSSVSLKKTTQKNIGVLSSDSIVKQKQTPRSCSSIKQENESCQKKTPLRKTISTIVSNTGSEIIIKKERILFFDIPIHTKQKKTTRPVPFSFENRDKIKKQLKLDQEAKNTKSELVTNAKLISSFNKTQKHINKFGNFAKKGTTSFIRNRVINEKDKDMKQPKQSEKVCTSCVQPMTIRKPMRTISGLKNNKYGKGEDKTGKEKNENIHNRKDINKERNALKSIFGNNMHSYKNVKIQEKGTLATNKYIQKENKQSNINVSTKPNNTLIQNKEIKLRNTLAKSSVKDREKKREFEEKMRQRKIMHEEKLKKEREEKLAKEKLEIAKLRQQTAIKAKPMPVYKPFIQIKSIKPLTQPQSPAWKSKHRVPRVKETL